MERNYDWKAPVALVLAGLALFIALGGRNAFDFSPQPANVVVELHSAEVMPFTRPDVFPVPAAPTVVPAVPQVPESRYFGPGAFGTVTYDDQGGPFWGGWRHWSGHMPPFVPVLLALGLIFIGWRVLSRNRHQHAHAHPYAHSQAHAHMHAHQAPAPPYGNSGPETPPPPPSGPPYYGDINQRQSDS